MTKGCFTQIIYYTYLFSVESIYKCFIFNFQVNPMDYIIQSLYACWYYLVLTKWWFVLIVTGLFFCFSIYLENKKKGKNKKNKKWILLDSLFLRYCLAYSHMVL
ncbi:hypothetical protein KUI_0119 [Taylorella equigenitalis ATCC 35865]|uniref:Uncharacterized protein n=1 Tax=Taylorella equigenitalis ATCC 35865 TaxID=743973 RepID=A0ABM5N8Q8_9BURK|nr:hypothetical protein KUI_0119 [Taylorella equigenitalis ATCC 35865]